MKIKKEIADIGPILVTAQENGKVTCRKTAERAAICVDQVTRIDIVVHGQELVTVAHLHTLIT